MKATRSRRQRNAPTIADVATEAGVSQMTVSRVINDGGVVRASTRERVEHAIRKLNYSPSAAARALATGDEVSIGLLYSNPSSAYLSEFLVGGLDQASRSHVQLIIAQADDDPPDPEAIDQLLKSRIDGIILLPPLCDSPIALEMVRARDVAMVAVASGNAELTISGVAIDDHAAAFAMTAHLIALGHRRIGFIIGNPNHTASAARLAGYRAALDEADIDMDEALIVQGLFSYRSGLDAAERLLDLSALPTAIFASNDDMAVASVAVAHRRGLDIPRDLTVCGFDDTALATTIWPELTTIRQPIAEMARAAIDTLVREIRDRRDGVTGEPRHRLLDFELIRRHSDAAPSP